MERGQPHPELWSNSPLSLLQAHPLAPPTWNLRCWPGAVTRVEQLSHSITSTERKRQQARIQRGSPERLRNTAGTLSDPSGVWEPSPPAPIPPQGPATHRDMQLRKSLSCSSSGSTLTLLLVLTRILAFLTLSKGPKGSERQVAPQWLPGLPLEATTATERRKEVRAWRSWNPGTEGTLGGRP